MTNTDETKEQLAEELAEARQRIVQLEALDSERTWAQQELRRTLRAFKVLSGCNQVIIRATDESNLLAEVCRVIVDVGGYRLAWVGFTEADKKKTVRPMAQQGYEQGYLTTANITWADDERGRGPTGTAIRTGKPVVVRDILTDSSYAPWRREAIRRGYASAIALPLGSGQPAFGALNIYATEPDAFDAEEVKLLTELAGDLTYAITALRTETQRQQAEELSQTVIDSSPIGIYIVQDGKLKMVGKYPLATRLQYSTVQGLPLPISVFPKKRTFVIRQNGIWNHLGSVLSNLVITFRAYYDAIVCLFAPLVYGYSGYGIPAFAFAGSSVKISSTSSACSPQCLSVKLPSKSTVFGVSTKGHDNSPLYTWGKGLWGEYGRLYKDGKDTGISITPIHRVFPMFLFMTKGKTFKLKHTVYAVSFFHSDGRSHILDIPSLREAKQIGEWYYKEWLRANQNYYTE